MRSCPHCGASLHEEASFCPYCSQAVNERKEGSPPRHMPRRALYSALLVFSAAAVFLLLSFLFRSRPRVYDNDSADIIYSSQGVDYQLCIAWADTPFTPVRQRSTGGVMNESYRYPVLLYISLADRETFAADAFLEQVDRITAEVSGADEGLDISCTQPVRNTDYVPDSAAIVYMDYIATTADRHFAELTISVQMKNGDVLRLHQTQIIDVYMTYDYTVDDAPMDTVQDLQALLKQIEATTRVDDEINIHLPPVTYTEEFVWEGRPVSFIGSSDGTGHRTTFAAPVRVTNQSGWLFFFDNISFTGPGSGTGLSASARVHLTDCRVAGWDTGVLAHTNAWVNIDNSIIEDNTVGFHFNAETGSPSDTQFQDNIFRDNTAAVLLERVPNQVSLKFPGTRFSGNSIDIDNRCGQALDLSGATFE